MAKVKLNHHAHDHSGSVITESRYEVCCVVFLGVALLY